MNNYDTTIKCDICKSHYLRKISETEYQCECCGTTKIVNNISQDYINLVRAHALLSEGKFVDADEAFTNITNNNPKYYDALWGKLLAHYGITIEYENGKGIPTLHDWIEDNILENDIYKRLINKIDKNKREIYVSLANDIEKTRKIAYEKYKNEEEYDIFISFKQTEDSDRNIKTKDYYEAIKLHSLLIKKGYKVFFSPVTLQEEAGKEYEPIVFHALRTAKILIVYGQKAEHFEATWVKNEWSRYLELVKNENKLEGSCIVCIENMNAYDLPLKLRMIQVIDFTGNHGAYESILTRIEFILSEYDKKYNHVKTVSIENKQIKRIGNLSKNEIKRYDFNSSNVTIETDDVIRTLNLANEKLKSQEYDRAKKLFEKVLKEYPNNAIALLGRILSENKINSLDNIKVIATNIEIIDKAIKNSIKEDAINVFLNPITDSLKKYIDKFNLDEDSYKVYKCLINIEYERSTELNDFILEQCIKTANYEIFTYAIMYVNNDVDKIITFYEKMQTSLVKHKKYDLASKLINETLEIEEGNNKSLYNKLLCYIGDDLIVSKMDEEGYKLLDDLLSYTKESKQDDFLYSFYKLILNQKITVNTAKLVKELLGRIKGKELWITISLEIAEKLKNNNFFEEAKEFYEIFLQNSSENKDKGYAGILLCKYNCKTFDELVNQDKDFTGEKELDILQSLSIDKKLHDYYFSLDKKWNEKQTKKRVKKNIVRCMLFLIIFALIVSSVILCANYVSDYSNGEWILSEYDAILSDGTIEGGVLERPLFNGLYVQKCELSEIIEKYKEISIVQKPKCESVGIYYFDVDKYNRIYFTVPKLGHNYTDWEVVTYPIETENGLMQRTCKNDSSYIETKELPKLTSDEYTDVSLTYYSACEEIRKYGLNVEGVKISFDIKTVTGGHNFTEWKLMSIPTETEPGLLQRTCLNDNSHVESVEIPELTSSAYEINVLKVASCNQKGLNTYTYFYDNQEITFEVSTESMPHNFNGYICTNCSLKRDYYIDGDYIYIGEYPQTIKDENVTILNIIDNTNYYLGSDGEKYVKTYLTDYLNNPNTQCAFYTFTNGKKLFDNNDEYYFKVEPVKWKILKNNNGEVLIFSEKILNTHRFDYMSSYYDTSEVKSYLNNEMYNEMFSDEQKSIIIESNEKELDITRNLGKLFLLSKEEIVNTQYGFNNSLNESDTARMKQVTDYAIINYANYNYIDEVILRNGIYWLRTYYGSSRASCIHYGGSFSYSNVISENIGLAPALRITIR